MKVILNHLDGSAELIKAESLCELEAFLCEQGLAGAKLVVQGSILNYENAQLLLKENANIYVTGGLDGGKKKKKKKAYTTKKKNKHIHKKIKGLTLRLYSVDKSGNVTSARKSCPNCGNGTFMAQHWDRHYCGLCHITIKLDAETIKKNKEIVEQKKAAIEAERRAKEKEAADKAPIAKGKKDAKKAAAKKK